MNSIIRAKPKKRVWIMLIIFLIVLGVSSYYVYSYFKTYIVSQKIDSLIGQYSMVKDNHPFQEVLRASSNPQQVYSFDEFKTLLAKAKSDSQKSIASGEYQMIIGIFYNINDSAIYFNAMKMEIKNNMPNQFFYMVFYIDK